MGNFLPLPGSCGTSSRVQRMNVEEGGSYRVRHLPLAAGKAMG